MPDRVIENPVINSPFVEPNKHFRFDDEGITNEVVGGRRSSSYFVPIPASKKKGKQLVFDTEWTKDRVEENETINRVRQRVALWRKTEYPDITATTRRLLRHWTDPDRENTLFFCQIEALETVVYLTEAAAVPTQRGNVARCALPAPRPSTHAMPAAWPGSSACRWGSSRRSSCWAAWP